MREAHKDKYRERRELCAVGGILKRGMHKGTQKTVGSLQELGRRADMDSPSKILEGAGPSRTLLDFGLLVSRTRSCLELFLL